MIPFKLEKINHRVVIIVKCPKCGNFGMIQRNGTASYGNKYRIVHKTDRNCYANGEYACSISYFDESYDEIDKIYKSYRVER